MKRSIFFVFLLFVSFLTSISSGVEPEEKTLEPVVVTATRIETPVKEVTTSITVITEKEIREQQAETVLDVLRDVPGVDVIQTGSRGAVASVFIRGSNSNQVLVLVDGMEVNSVTAGLFDFAHLLTDNVERIEILRGAGGTLHGSKAVGGVINILTKKGKAGPELITSLEGGNGSTHRETVNFSGGSDRWNYSVTGSFLKTDGFRRVNDDYKNISGSAKLGLKPMDHASLTATFWTTETRLGLSNSNNFLSVPDPNDRQEDQFWAGRIQWKHEPVKSLDYRFGLGMTQGHQRNVTRIDSIDTTNRISRIRPQIINPEFQIHYRLNRLAELTFGVDWDIREAKFSGIQPKQNNQALYVQNRFHMLDENFIVVGGIRWDHNEDFGQEWSPSGSFAYLVPKLGTKLKANYVQSFRAPTFNDLFFPGFSDPNLSPETAWETDIGIEQPLFKDRLHLEAIYFHREVKDLIVFRGFSPENVGQAIFDGVEFIAALKLPWGLSWRGNYTFLNISDRIIRRPKHKGNLTLNYKNGPLNFNLNTHITGRRLDIDANTFRTIDKGGYTRFDLAASYVLPWRAPGVKSVSLYGKIENLFDRGYEEADGFRARPINFLIGIRGAFGRN
ncbi:MAG: TonB-dependent receptor plug domain-containing protein [Candidatus Binatia bacterium]